MGFFSAQNGSSLRRVLFVPVLHPAAVFRSVERNAPLSSPFSHRSSSPAPQAGSPTPLTVSIPILLSGPPKYGINSLSWRVLFADRNGVNADAAEAAHRFLFHLGPQLSRELDTLVYGLETFPSGVWRFIQWDAGTLVKNGGTATESTVRPLAKGGLSFLQRGLRGQLPPSLQAWARENKLPLADAPFERPWKRRANIVDYDAVAGLERKGLLIETTQVWYRVTVDVPIGEADGGIIQEP